MAVHAWAFADMIIDKLFEQTVESPKKQAEVSVQEPWAEFGEIPAFPERTNGSEEVKSETNKKTEAKHGLMNGLMNY